MRRLNVKLAVWLVVITVTSAVGVHFLHAYQLDRNANVLKGRAEQAQIAGNLQEAIKQYNQYLRHRDDRAGYQALAELVVDVAEREDATNRDKIRAYSILEEAIRRHSDLDDVRASLIDYSIMVGRFPDAQEHIQYLQDNGNNDPELEYKSALCLFASGDVEPARKKLCKIVGYDDLTEKFVDERPETATEVEAFSLLGQIYYNRSGGQAQADAVMKQLVKWNPESSDAQMAYGRFLRGVWRSKLNDRSEGAEERSKQMFAQFKQAFETAHQLAPDDADSLLEVATTAMLERDYAKAESLLDQARKEHPERQDVYVRSAELAMAQGKRDQASERLLQGLEEAQDTRKILEQLIDVQFQLRDLAAVRKTIERMRELDAVPREFVRYQEARLKFAEGKFIEATRDFERVRTAMERLDTRELQRVNLFLANCYEVLGLPDQQLEVYRRLLDSYPNLLMARVGEASSLQALGRHPEAETSVNLLAAVAKDYPQLQPAILQLAVNQELNSPEAERDWRQVDEVAALVYQNESRTPSQNELLKADLLLARGQRDAALQVLSALRRQDPKNVAVWVGLCKLLAADENNRQKIPQLLDLAAKQIGDVAALRSERVKALMRREGELPVDDVRKLEAGIDQFTDAEQRALFQQLARAYLRAGSDADGMRCFQAAIATDPKNGRLRQLVFELAMERGDEATAGNILKELGDSKYFGPESPLYKYCAAAQRLRQIEANSRQNNNKLTEADREALADVRKEIREAVAVREEWAPLWRLLGEVDRLEGNLDSAITNLQRSLDYSRFNQELTARRLVTLLYAARRYTEANEALKYLSGAPVPELLRQVKQDIKLKSGETGAALEMAKKEVDENPQDPMKHIHYGRILNTVGKSGEAEAAFRKATQVGPELPAAWELLVRRLLLSRKKNEAVVAVREAAQTLSGDPLAMAGLYELVDDRQQAEQLFQQAIAAQPDDLAVLKRVVEFNIASKQPQKAAEYLDQMIEKGLNASQQNGAAYVRWARRAKARQTATAGDYQSTMAAVELIKQNSQDDQLDPGDMLSIIALLGDRPEHASRVEAIRLLEKLKASQGLNGKQMSALGKLYESEGQWSKAKEMMLAAVNDRSNDPAVFIVFAQMLLDNDEPQEAARYANQAEELLAKASTPAADSLKREFHTVRARLLIAEDKQQEAAQVIEGLLVRPLPQNQLVRLSVLSRDMERLGLYEDAQRLLEEYMSQEPRAAIAVAAFKGRRGEVDEAFELLEQSRQNQPAIQTLPVALEALRYYPDAATPERLKLLEKWAHEALGAEVNPMRIQLLLSELYDLQGRYDESAKLFRDMLANPELPPLARARVQNNLAFLLAAVNPTPQRGAEAEKLVNEAIRVLGPRADVLDTRAVAYLAQGKNKEAAEDMRIALIDSPSVPKYYHLAQVQQALGNTDAAREAINKALELKDDRNPFTPAEKAGFEKLQRELN